MKEERKSYFDFYYGKDAEQFNFYRIPKLLFTDERLKKLSTDAKVLYGLMLDRMSLSIKNDWFDDNNRVYIYFTLEDVIEYLDVCKDKATKLFAELDDVKGVGLIKRKRQGLGKPMMVYVMNFNSCKIDNDEVQDETSRDFNTPEKQDTGLPIISDSCFLKNRSTDSCNFDSNNIKYNNIENSNNNHILSSTKNDEIEDIKARGEYRTYIEKNIEYNIIVQNYGKEYADELLEIMLDAVCSKKPYLTISGADIPQAVVKSRLLKLNYTHIEYVVNCLNENTTKIFNIKSYILTTLYNSFSTINSYYRAKVNYDMHGKD